MGTEGIGASELQNQQTKYKKPSTGKIIGGIVAGNVVKNAISQIRNPISDIAFKKMKLINNNLTQDEFEQISKAADGIVKNTGLGKKGIEIIKANSDNIDEISSILEKEFAGIGKLIPKKVKNIESSLQAINVSTGQNAFFAIKSNKVVIPESGLSSSVFHELGHAMNANLNGITKTLQKSRNLMLLSIPIALIALLKTKKADGEKPKNKLDKATDFIKNNAGKLTFATFLPIITEEGLASIRGGKAAKNLLSGDLFKKVCKTNIYGFSTYFLLAATLSAGLALGVKVKDKIAHNEEINQK